MKRGLEMGTAGALMNTNRIPQRFAGAFRVLGQSPCPDSATLDRVYTASINGSSARILSVDGWQNSGNPKQICNCSSNLFISTDATVVFD